MLAVAARQMSIDLYIQTPSVTDPAVSLAKEVILAPLEDLAATACLAEKSDLITFENEFVNVHALQNLAQKGIRFYPDLNSLQPVVDKGSQRRLLSSLNLPTPRFTLSGSVKDSPLPLPVVLKSRIMGYDGQGTYIIKDPKQWQSIVERYPQKQWLVEEWIPFERELAIVVARSGSGQQVFFPIVETQQVDQVCHWALVPAELDPKQEQEIQDIASKLLDYLNWVGVLAIEFFLTQEGKILINELAPRTHNSGHFTLDACSISQFHSQLQAITNQPLTDPILLSPGAVMVNLLGYEEKEAGYSRQLELFKHLPKTYVHWYGKSLSRPGRKLGHVTSLQPTSSRQDLIQVAQHLESIWYPKA
jgi:5-(carboxyamino)imidazole ribonucleotide synthase